MLLFAHSYSPLFDIRQAGLPFIASPSLFRYGFFCMCFFYVWVSCINLFSLSCDTHLVWLAPSRQSRPPLPSQLSTAICCLSRSQATGLFTDAESSGGSCAHYYDYVWCICLSSVYDLSHYIDLKVYGTLYGTFRAISISHSCG